MFPESNSKLLRLPHQSHARGWMHYFEPNALVTNGQRGSPKRALFLVAHPDDETIGASAALSRLPNPVVLYLTDGAPHDRRFWSSFGGSGEEYARVRLQEAKTALALAGVSSQRILTLGAADQDSIYEVPILVEKLLTILRWFRPAVVITHPYEGGHPDHDAAALAANIARHCLQRERRPTPVFLEMTSYHARDGRCQTGEFLPDSTGTSEPILTIELSPEEKAKKQKMMEHFASQGQVLQGFPIGPERLREAREYDFARPPHEGPLWYELLGWPMRGEHWREMAVQAFQAFGESLCA